MFSLFSIVHFHFIDWWCLLSELVFWMNRTKMLVFLTLYHFILLCAMICYKRHILQYFMAENLADGMFITFEKLCEWKWNISQTEWSLCSCILVQCTNFTSLDHFIFISYGVKFGWNKVLGNINLHCAYYTWINIFVQRASTDQILVKYRKIGANISISLSIS